MRGSTAAQRVRQLSILARRMSEAKAIEARVESYCSEQQYDDATAALLRGFGAEILGVLVAMARDDAQAADAYSLFCERAWRGIPKFRFECSCRTWAYTIAKRTLFDLLRRQRVAPDQPWSHSALPDIVQQAASSTAPHVRTTYKRELHAVRATLSPEDQLLLVLRIDKALPWNDVARVLAEQDAPSVDEIQRVGVAIRKRFSRAKKRLADELRAQRAHERSKA